MNKYIVTYAPCFEKNMLLELEKGVGEVRIVKKFDHDLLLIECDKMVDSDLIFVKHLMPVMKSGIVIEKEMFFENLLEEVIKIVELKNEKFAVQCRIKKGDGAFSAKDVEVFLGTYFEKNGAVPAFVETESVIKIISVFIFEKEYYIGFSTNVENLNYHCDEYRLFSKNGRQVSRAENKLKEAIAKFKIPLIKNGMALDIGAAPGGWSLVLADYGYHVLAVDPGNLKESVLNNPLIKHFKGRIEDLKINEQFDMIVNDMNVDPKETSLIMNQIASLLKKDGIVILTLKLPIKSTNLIFETISILEEQYQVVAIKSLFHNRQEVTLVLKK